MPIAAIPPCPVCGNKVRLLYESGTSFRVRCNGASSKWHEFDLVSREEYDELAEAQEFKKLLKLIMTTINNNI